MSFVEYYRGQAINLDNENNKKAIGDNNKETPHTEEKLPAKKRGIFNKIGSKLASKLFDNRTDPARASAQDHCKERTPGFWSTLGSKFVSGSQKSTQEPYPPANNQLSWDGEYRTVVSGELSSSQSWELLLI